jgi:hypothetical protein
VPSAKTALDARAVAPATNMAAMGVQPVEPGPATKTFAPVAAADARPAAGAAVPAAAAPTADEPAPATSPKRAAKKPAKPKQAKLGYRSADALFNP